MTADPAPRVSDEYLQWEIEAIRSYVGPEVSLRKHDFPADAKFYTDILTELLALRARNAELEALARDVAANDWFDDDSLFCEACGAVLPEHAERCLRVRAIELTGGGA